MAQDNVHRLQDTFLEHLQRKRTPVTIFLSNSVRLRGTIVGFDAFCVLLECDGQQQIIYKHAISAALPAYAVDLRDDADAPDKAAPPKPAATRPPVIVERRRSRFARP